MNIVFVTNNQNKLSEIKNLVSSNYNILNLKDIDFHNDIDETENTLEGNAMLKAKCIHSRFGLDCFADDTGLEIDVLDGKPGVYSARYAGPQCNAKDNIDKVLSELKNFENRNAKFITVIALNLPLIFGGAIITEQVFKVNGIGQQLILAIYANDLPTIQTLTFIFAFLIVFFNLVADVLYALLDPRIRYE